MDASADIPSHDDGSPALGALQQEVAQQLQREAESYYFQHWREDAFDQEC